MKKGIQKTDKNNISSWKYNLFYQKNRGRDIEGGWELITRPILNKRHTNCNWFIRASAFWFVEKKNTVVDRSYKLVYDGDILRLVYIYSSNT